MRKIYLILISMMGTLCFAQTNELTERPFHGKGERSRGEKRMREMSPEQHAKLEKHRLKLMEKTLKDIGVTREQSEILIKMSIEHKKKMRVSVQKMNEAREALRALEQSEDASEEDVYRAIDVVATAQADQMKLLFRGRMETKRVLGKEKYAQFMKVARTKWKEGGGRERK